MGLERRFISPEQWHSENALAVIEAFKHNVPKFGTATGFAQEILDQIAARLDVFRFYWVTLRGPLYRPVNPEDAGEITINCYEKPEAIEWVDFVGRKRYRNIQTLIILENPEDPHITLKRFESHYQPGKKPRYKSYEGLITSINTVPNRVLEEFRQGFHQK